MLATDSRIGVLHLGKFISIRVSNGYERGIKGFNDGKGGMGVK